MTSAGPETGSSGQPYQVVARRFRPKSFDELVGQEAVVRSLGSSLQSGRVPHAFLFAGSRGVGKTTSARILARALNCERGIGPDPCGDCATCRSTLAGTNPDVIEIDAASHNLVDDIRELCDRVGVASMGSRYKVYILDEVHMLTRNAFNAFLKTLEEPPRNVVFVLATTELHKVPETVRSRCQVVLFRRIDERDVVSRLRGLCACEGVAIDDAVLEEIALSCRGGMRDAETALERVLPLARDATGTFGVDAWRQLTQRVGFDRAVEVVTSLCAGDASAALRFADEAVSSGVDERETLGELLEVLRALLLCKIDGPDSGLVAVGGALRERIVALAATIDAGRIDAMMQAGLLGRDRIRRADDRRLVLELALVRMADAGRLATLAELVAAVESGAPVVGPAATQSVVAGTGIQRAAGTGGSLLERFVAKVRHAKPMLAATAAECLLDGPNEVGAIHLGLRTDRKMHVDRLTSPEVLAFFRGILTELCGREISLEVARRSAATGTTPTPPDPSATALPTDGIETGGASARPRATGVPVPGERVQRVRSRFDGIIEPPAAT